MSVADVALLTKSYAGDFAMCRALCESVDRLMPDMVHHVVVDRADRALFAPLETDRRVILETERYLPELLPTAAFGRRLWIAPYGPPMRGWIYQQIAKLAVVATLPQKAVVIVDSDVVFLRALDPSHHLRDGRARLYLAPGAAQGGEHRRWHRAAASLLGLPRTGYFGADYITNGVTWSPAVVRALLDRIRSATWLPWRMALSWRLRLSEYILYGVFADHVDGPHRDLLFHDRDEICHCSWHYNLADPEGRAAFAAGLRPHHSAVLLQSNLGLDLAERDRLLRSVASRAGLPVGVTGASS